MPVFELAELGLAPLFSQIICNLLATTEQPLQTIHTALQLMDLLQLKLTRTRLQ